MGLPKHFNLEMVLILNFNINHSQVQIQFLKMINNTY